MKVAYIEDAEDHITIEAVAGSSTKLVPAGSVICVMRSGILRHSFPVAVTRRMVTMNQDLRALHPRQDVLPEFLAFYLNAVSQAVLHRCSKDGTTVNSIDTDQLMAWPVPICEPDEQARIVETVAGLFEQIDDGENALVEAQAATGIYKHALLKAAVSGELTADWRANNPPEETGMKLLARILSARRALWEADPRNSRKKYVEPCSPDTDGLPDLPAGWTWATVQQLSTLVTSGSRGWSEYYAPEGDLFIRAANLNQDRLDLSDVAFVRLPSNSEGMRTRVMRDDFLITITGANVTKCGVVDQPLEVAYVSQHVGLVRPVTAEISQYLYLWSRAYGGGKQYLEDAAYGAGKPGLNLPNIYEMVVALPPPGEQAEIAARVQRLVEQLPPDDGDLDTLTDQLRQSILTAAFRGELLPEQHS